MRATLFQTLIDRNRQHAKPERFMHVLGVTHTATALALRHGADATLAALAGLLHDVSKPLAPEAIEADLRRRGIAIPDEDRDFPAVWHGFHAAALARSEFGLTEADGADRIARAVAIHSTGDADADDLAKILFVADYTEPGRDFEDVEALRAAAREDLDRAYRMCLESKCRHVAQKRGKLSPRAQRALEAWGASAQNPTTPV